MGKGWLGAPLISKRLCKVQKLEARNARALRRGVKGPAGAKPLVGVQGGKPWKLLCFSMQKQHFQRKHIHKIGKFNTFLRTITLTPSPFLMSWSPFLMVTWKVTCTLSLPTPTNISNGHLAILNIPSTAFHIAWPSDSDEYVPLRKLYPPELPNSNTIS